MSVSHAAVTAHNAADLRFPNRQTPGPLLALFALFVLLALLASGGLSRFMFSVFDLSFDVPPSADECVNRLLVPNSAHTSFCTVKLRYPSVSEVNYVNSYHLSYVLIGIQTKSFVCPVITKVQTSTLVLSRHASDLFSSTLIFKSLEGTEQKCCPVNEIKKHFHMFLFIVQDKIENIDCQGLKVAKTFKHAGNCHFISMCPFLHCFFISLFAFFVATDSSLRGEMTLTFAMMICGCLSFVATHRTN